MAEYYPQNYDPMLVTVVVNGKTLTGVAEEFITIDRSEDSIFPAVGAQGDVGYAKNANRTGTAQVSMMQTSPSLPYLRELSQNYADIDLSIVDNNEPDKVHFHSIGGKILKVPTYGRNKQIGNVPVTFHIPYLMFNA
ncbi:hypothetical protein AGMMS49992_20070 [Clostridia bacterium]|nr:hypothetical protein AGMMS49992_20070 [Clostridia bacterium]